MEKINNDLKEENKTLRLTLGKEKEKVYYLESVLKGLHNIFNDKYLIEKKNYEKINNELNK